MNEPSSPGRFLKGLAIRATSLVVATACINFLVNPFGGYPTRLIEPITLATRGPKLSLYKQRRPAPEIVVLGSSRSFRMEPAYIQARTSQPAFNASVQTGAPPDYLDFARCFAAQPAFPSTLILGLGVEQVLGFRQQPSERADPLADCRLEKDPLSALARYRRLLTLEETWASLRSLRLETTGRPAPVYRIEADGLTHGPDLRGLERRLGGELEGSWGPAPFATEAVDRQSLEQIRQLLELSRSRGARVIVYLPPYHPRALSRYLAESRFPALRSQLLEQLASWTKEYPVRVHDFTELGRGRDELFDDALHPTAAACRLMLDVMLADVN